jgi:hypothetical protein
MPVGSITYGDLDNPTPEDVEMYGYDNGAYYFVIEKTLPTAILENTRYELQRIHNEFYGRFDADTTATRFTEAPLAFMSASKIGSRDIRLKSVISGPKYYLMGSVGATQQATGTFFNSFALAPEAFSADFRTYTDTLGGYAIEVPKKQNERLDFIFKHKGFRGGDEKKNHFEKRSGDAEFTLPSGRTVEFSYDFPHRYEPIMPADSVWASIRERYDYDEKEVDEDDYTSTYVDDEGSYNPMSGKRGIKGSEWYEQVTRSNRKAGLYRIENEKTSHNKVGGYSQMDFMLVQDNSNQAIKERYYYRNGVVYEMSAMVGRDYRNDDPQLEKIFDSVRFFNIPDDTLASLPADKVKLFIEDAKSEHDSIRFSAFESIYRLEIKEKDLKPLMQFLEEFDFSSEEAQSLNMLYGRIGNFTEPSVIPFLEKQYKKEDVTMLEQFAILQALTNQYSKEGYKKIMELLEYDLPLSDKGYMVSGLFGSFMSDTENSATLVPDIFQFYTIREYHDPILSFTAELLENEDIKPKKIKSIKKMVLTNARLELKRTKSQKSLRDEDEDEDVYVQAYEEDDDTAGLTAFMEILYPFREEKGIKQFFASVKALNMKDLNLEMARLGIVNENIDKEALAPLLDNPETLFTVYNIGSLKKHNIVEEITDDKLAASAMHVLNGLDKDKDTLTLVEKRDVSYNDVPVVFYFFRLATEADEDDDTPETDRLVSIAFVKNQDGRINTHAYRDVGIKEIDDEDKIAGYIEDAIDVVLNENYDRASTGKGDDDMNYPYDNYNDLDY